MSYLYAGFFSIAWGLFHLVAPTLTPRASSLEGRSVVASEVHAIGTSLLAVASVLSFTHDQGVLLAFTVPYFVIDSILCAVNADVAFLVHHLLTLGMIAQAQRSAFLVEGRVMSHVLLVELSTIVLNWWSLDPSNILRYRLLVLVYFVNRVLFLGWYAWSPTGYLSTMTSPPDILGR